jgi:ADP-heptose:LPS heptosyltransferase
MPLLSNAHFLRASLREMMALMTCCDIFICNDSGPMHIADALGVPVVGIFTTGNPVWHRPFGENQRFVGRGTGHDFVSYPTREEVLSAALAQIARVRPSSGKESAMESADR